MKEEQKWLYKRRVQPVKEEKFHNLQAVSLRVLVLIEESGVDVKEDAKISGGKVINTQH